MSLTRHRHDKPYPLELSPVVEPSADLSAAIEAGYLEGIVLKDRTAEYRSGFPSGLVEAQVTGLVRAASWKVRPVGRKSPRRRSVGCNWSVTEEVGGTYVLRREEAYGRRGGATTPTIVRNPATDSDFERAVDEALGQD